MRERHPIDDLFRQGLRNAEAAPPAAVWQGIVRKRGWGHRTLVLLQRRWGLALLALLLLGSSAAWVVTSSGPDSSGSTSGKHANLVAEEPASSGVEEALLSRTVGSASPAPETQAHLTSEAAQDPVASVPGIAQPHAAVSAALKGTGPRSQSLDEASSVSPSQPQRDGASGSDLQDAVASSNGPESHQLDANGIGTVPFDHGSDEWDAQHMFGVLPLLPLEDPGMHLLQAQHVDPYVLPKGEWWVGVEYGAFRLDRDWRAQDEQLAGELDQAEQGSSAQLAGLAVGYQWRNGFGVSSGFLLDMRRSRFGHEQGRDSLVTLELTTLVTFDTLVLGSYTNLVTENVGDKRTYTGTGEYELFSIPVEVDYRWSTKRWMYGASAGLIANFYRSESGYTLTRTSADAISTTGLTNGDNGARFGAMLSATASLDLGFLLTEHWSLWASPTLSQDVASLSPTDAPTPFDRRIGARFRLAFTIPSHK